MRGRERGRVGWKRGGGEGERDIDKEREEADRQAES